MSKVKKTVIVAAVLIVAGIITIVSAFAVNGFRWPNVRLDLRNMKSDDIHYEKKTEYIDKDFRKIDIESASDIDVAVKKADGDTSYVEYYDCTGLTHHIDVNDGVLKVTADDKRNKAFYVSIGLDTNEWPSVTVYLAGTAYDELKIVTGSGDVNVEYYLEMKNIDIAASSGDIRVSGANIDDITVEANSGYITLDSVVAKNVKLSASSGDLTLDDVVISDKAEMKTNSGDIDSKNIKSKYIDISASSGDVSLTGSDADSFTIVTTSGDVSLDIDSVNKFYYKVKTSSGDVDVPDSYVDAEGSCDIKTSSGDIDVTENN